MLTELDVLVHNAGVAYPGRVAESTPEQWRATFEVNVIGPVALTWRCCRRCRQPRAGCFRQFRLGIECFAGPGVVLGEQVRAAGFRRLATRRRAPLRVTSIHPGRVDTEMQRDLVCLRGRQYDPAKFLTPQTVARGRVAGRDQPAGRAHPPGGDSPQINPRNPRRDHEMQTSSRTILRKMSFAESRRASDDDVDQPAGDHDHLLGRGSGQEALNLPSASAACSSCSCRLRRRR